MIALNEILTKKEYFEQKYKLMKKKVYLEKIIKLEEKFIVLDKKANNLRSECNKLCGEFSKIIEKGENSSAEILKINKLDKEINQISNRSQKSMKKINTLLQKLPNPASDDNILSIAIKTKQKDFSKNDFIGALSKISNIENIDLSEKKYYSSLKKIVLKAENLPKLTRLAKSNDIILMCEPKNINEYYKKVQDLLTQNAKYLVLKSIQRLAKNSSKTLVSTLYDGTFLTIDLLGEYVSRENSIKFYDKNLDMTQFVNMIKISIK